MSESTQPPKRECRWYQFSMRTLLVVMLVFCVTVAWVGSRMYKAQKNRERVADDKARIMKAEAVFRKLRGEVTYDYKIHRPQTWLEELFDDPGDRDDVVGSFNVRIRLPMGSAGDASLEPLNELNSVISFRVYYHARENIWNKAPITDAGLTHLRDLKRLQTLHLRDTMITDAGLTHLKGLSNLKELNLYGTSVSDEGVKKLQQALPNCEIFR
jgi:hypothetical protein